MALPTQYQWLLKEPGPKMLLELLKVYGTHEVPGSKDNPDILEWADELGLKNQYTHDSIPWCGLAIAIAAKRAGKPVVKDPLWAANWAKWGTKVSVAMLGDVLVFSRPGGNHVAIYVGEDKTHYHILGGNQGDQISIVRIDKDRCIAIVRPPYTVQPPNVRRVYLSDQGTVSTNEA